ncbi:MAG: tripartite tricarboxylate transporter substrate binding protein [Pseudomonadota bacterium]
MRTPSKLVTRLMALAAALAFSATAIAQEWAPNRPMKILVPYTAGAGADITARLVAGHLATALGQPVIVDNKGGGGGIIGTDAGAKSPPDGYTLVWGSDVAFTINPLLQAVPYDPIKDFEPVSLFVNLPMVLVVNPQKVAANNVKELIALVKAKPGFYSIASAGNGSSHHFAAEFLRFKAGVDILHVPYRGAAQGLNDVLGGQADMMFISPASVLQHLKTGKVKALGMSTSRRLPNLPDVPTLAEAGVPGYDVGIWMGMLYQANVPKAAITRVNAELSKILEMPEVKARILDLGYTSGGGTPDVLAKRIASDTAMYRKLIQDAKIKID